MINLTYYETIAEGDMQFIFQMVKTFVDDVPVMLKAIDEKLEQRDYPALGKAIHKLKPAWSMSGLDVNLIVNLETELKMNAQYETIHSGVNSLNATAIIALNEMNIKLSELSTELLNKKRKKK